MESAKKYFPKKFCENTSIDVDGYPIYRRRDNGVNIKKGESFVDNKLVPYNKYLLLKFNAHINVEWCNQTRLLNIFLNISSTGVSESNCVDEIKMYYDCRYLSSEVVVFNDKGRIDDVLHRPHVQNTKFLAWMEANKRYLEAKLLTYSQFPLHFVWKDTEYQWTPRKKGGEIFYLRMLLNYVKGPESYAQIRTLSRPEYVCNNTWQYLTDDILHRQRTILQFPELKSFAFIDLEKLLQSNNKSLMDFPSMPQPDIDLIGEKGNKLIHDELNYDRKALVVECIHLIGIAALLIHGGRTVHSRFAIPINVDENSTCNIKQGSPLAELIAKSKLIIWDEAPMTQTLGCHKFCQISPVIPKGKRQEVVHATINSSYLWNFCEVMTFTKNMRLQIGNSDSNVSERKEFSDWILGIGIGTIGHSNDVDINVPIPDDLVLQSKGDSLQFVVNSTYPFFLDNMNVGAFFQDSVILTPRNDIVDLINQYMFLDTPYFVNENNDTPDIVHTAKFFNTITASGLPNLVLKLKVGVLVMLLRNQDQSFGLRNGTRMIVTKLDKYVIEAKVYIPRLSLTPLDVRIPFKFQRRQFPLAISFAMTINKSQGQSLKYA
uniref:ATP-dependent DNA helicase n=1 Tax=Glycine max TaxID=3847 RepID=K7K7Z4_SOYBN